MARVLAGDRCNASPSAPTKMKHWRCTAETGIERSGGKKSWGADEASCFAGNRGSDVFFFLFSSSLAHDHLPADPHITAHRHIVTSSYRHDAFTFSSSPASLPLCYKRIEAHRSLPYARRCHSDPEPSITLACHGISLRHTRLAPLALVAFCEHDQSVIARLHSLPLDGYLLVVIILFAGKLTVPMTMRNETQSGRALQIRSGQVRSGL